MVKRLFSPDRIAKTSLLVFTASSCAAAYYLFPLFPVPAFVFFAAFTAFAVFTAALFFVKKTGAGLWFVPALLAAAFALGFANASAAKSPISPGLPPENVRALKGTLLDDPRALSRSGMARMRLANAWGGALPGISAGRVRASASGTATVFFPAASIPRLKEFGRGGEVFVEGFFSTKTSGKNYGPAFNARSVHVSRPAPALERFRTRVRTFLVQRLDRLDPKGLASALILGSRENLDGDLARSYREAGLSHILALSGMHLAFFSGLIALLLKRPLGKNAAALVGLLFIAVYIFIVGPQPSLVRAGLMYAMGALVLLSGGRGAPFLFLCAAFLLQTSFDTASGFTLSFLLSYAALAGILLTGGKIAFLLRGRLPAFLSEGLSASISAFIVTAPLTAAFFGILRPVGILAGLVLVPLTSLFMAFAQAGLVFGGFEPAAALLSKVLVFFQGLTEKIVSAAAAVPGINLAENGGADFSRVLAVTAISLALTVLIFFAENRVRRERSYLAPFA